MITAAVVAAVLTHVEEDRDALMRRWTNASKTRVSASRVLPDADLAPPPPPVSMRELASRELATPGRYRLKNPPPQPAPNPPWWQRALKWIGERWRDFLRTVFGRVRVGSTTAAVFADVFLVLIVGAMLFAGTRLVLGFNFGGRRAAQARPLEAPPDAAALYARACEAAARGDYAQAARLLFGSTLALLDVRGAVPGDASSTVGDVRRKLRRSDAAVVPSFDLVAAAFVAGTYAERPIGEREWDSARDAYDGIAKEPVA